MCFISSEGCALYIEGCVLYQLRGVWLCALSVEGCVAVCFISWEVCGCVSTFIAISMHPKILHVHIW